MSTSPRNNDLVSIQVPADVAEEVSARVSTGEYTSHGEVIRNGLRLLTEEDAVLNDADVEQWLRDVAVPIAEATQHDPSRSIPAGQIREHFAARRNRRA